jgi:hypothetical protein
MNKPLPEEKTANPVIQIMIIPPLGIQARTHVDGSIIALCAVSQIKQLSKWLVELAEGIGDLSRVDNAEHWKKKALEVMGIADSE